MLQVEHLLLINFNNKKYTFWESILTSKHKKLNTNYSASKQSVPQTCFSSYFQKGKIFPFRKESIFPFQKHHPLSENTKFTLLLCMSLAFGKLKYVSFGNDNHTLKFFTEDFENLLSSFFFQFWKSVIKIEQCVWLYLYFPFEKFHSDIYNKMADNMVLLFHMRTDFDISLAFWY